MLQPRLQCGGGREDWDYGTSFSLRIWGNRRTIALALIMVLAASLPMGSSQIVDDPFTVSPTPALRTSGADELTTVLLVNNGNGAGRVGDIHGRFLTVRPEVGLLTSTARTFIQEGTTTEFATQVLGTTLENGRLYAQYLKKSSRVLYENANGNTHVTPSVVTSWVGDSAQLQTRSFLQSHNDLLNADAPDWQDIDDRLDGSGTRRNHDKFVGNTDFVSFQSAVHIPVQGASYSSNLELGSAPKNLPTVNVSPDRSGNFENNARKLAAQKVLPIGDLPTFTIKTHFEPSAYQPDEEQNNMTHEQQRQPATYGDSDSKDDGRSPKDYFKNLSQGQSVADRKLQLEQSAPKDALLPKRTLATVTYYGFADFTTLVGDSVIVFSPNTVQPSSNFGHVTSIKGKATLSTLENRFGSNISPESTSIISVQLATAESTRINPWAVGINVDTNDTLENVDLASHQITPELKMSEDIMVSTESGSIISNIITSEQVESQKSEIIDTNPTFSLPTDQEIREIYASLSKAQGKDPTPSLTSEATSIYISSIQTSESKVSVSESNVQVLGGATTVFIDDDPFANFVESIAPSPSTSSIFLSTSTTATQINYESTTEEGVTTNIEQLDVSTLPPPSSADEEQTTVSSVNEEPIVIPETNLSPESPMPVEKVENCKSSTSQVFLTQVPKSGVVGDLNTRLNNGHQNDANLLAAFDIVQTTKYYCINTAATMSQIVEPQQVEKPEGDTNFVTSSYYFPATTDSSQSTEGNLEEDTTTEDLQTLPDTETESNSIKTSEKPEELLVQHLDEASSSENASGETDGDKDNEDYDTDNGSDEIDLIYKTLYTTYTYLTTFFQAESTIVSSHTEIVTNVITSTVGEDIDAKPTAVVAQIGDNEITATQTLQGDLNAKTSTITSKYTIPEELESLLHVDSSAVNTNDPTDYLDDSKYTKTFFTTYTYYTTIFADSETEIMSRTEVLTNYITEQASAIKNNLSASTSVNIINSDVLPDGQSVIPSPTSPLAADPSIEVLNTLKIDDSLTKNEKERITLVTDVRSSSSNGEQQLIGKGLRDPIDDQVSSESNTDEIIPSATLLLQTSFTTFTFYTTMYVGDNTNVVSRLETVTNVATETLQPTKMLSGNVDEATLPITYFTTFTYWTKLAKDGEITTLSREETISNVIEPTQEGTTATNDYASLATMDNSEDVNLAPTTTVSGETNMTVKSLPDLTTYYTTYTYYTTSYEANNTVTDSRFETVTNVVTPTSTSTLVSSSSFDVLGTEQISSQTVPEIHGLKEISTPDLVLYDYKHIVDADGVSTLYFTTQVVSSLNNEGTSIAITSSTSSLYIDETKKSSLSSEATDDGVSASRQYKTGLVRLIEGTRIGNSTTTLYQSKVIGTLIDDRYAQIIESTSSFLFEKTVRPTETVPTATLDPVMSTLTASHLDSLSGSISESGDSTISDQEEHIADTTPESSTDSTDEGDNDDIGSRDTLQSKKRTFAPVIRPFASRNRPTFAPKQKIITPSSATIITRSDITPTITATPALKTIGRYSSSKRGPISNAPINPNESSSSRRTFGRPIKSSSSSASAEGGSSAGYAPSRNRFASSSRTGPLLSSRRLGISASYRPSSGSGFRASALNPVSSKLRIKPTPLVSGSIGQATSATSSPDASAETEHSTNETTTIADEDENSRRNQNPLLRFRRPLNRPSGFTPIPRPSAGISNSPTISPRRNPLAGRAKTSSTTTTTTTTTAKPRPRSFQRPTISSLQGRSRPQNNLFPPRGLFQAQQQKTEAPLEVKQSDAEPENDSEYDDEDDADDDGEDDSQDENSRRRRSNAKLANQKTLSRTRRQADVLNRSRFRFRRPSTSAPSVVDEQTIANNDDESTVNPRSKTSSRYGSRYQSARAAHGQTATTSSTTTANLRSIRPTRPISPRTQFTLREKDNTSKGSIRPGSNFRRQQPTTSSIRRKTGTSTVGTTSRRLKSYNTNNNNNNVENSGLRSSGSRGRNGNTNASSRGRVRSRNRNEYVSDQESTELGTQSITVTHLIPAEVTVPVVNGQVTEYKNIVTAKTSTEVLGPHQYTQILGTNGQTSIFLTREDSSVNIAGATEVTRYLLHDSSTTTVTFTPTTIRGRKTSFSHVLPSTVYSVESVISTVQPQISANAPLANILLSQLLLGNLNLPSNPLIGALGQQPQDAMGVVTPTPIQPVTEYRTHTSTYVTTIFDGKSTILPVTFLGKKILTTVYDTTAQTITATEYSVDTIVNTPTQQPQQAQSIGQVAQVNSLLLQQLLLQQQQPQQQQLQTISPTTSPQIFLSDNLQDLDAATRSGDSNRHEKPFTTNPASSQSIRSRYNQLTEAANAAEGYAEVGASLDEARYNLATHVMSNGVELIIASEKVKYMEKQSSTSQFLKFANGHTISTLGTQSQQQKPLTLAPSTLKNQMILAMPSINQKQQKFTIPINDNQFITKTCLTTYTYHTTYFENGTTTVESKERVISNRHTEERNYLHASTTLPTDVILSRTSELMVGVFPTTYHYFNTIMDNDNEDNESDDIEHAVPVVITSKYTVLNTVTGPEDYISYLQPSELATPTHDTNTYFSRITFTKTLQKELESNSPKILVTENILTQVIVTESLPSRGAVVWKSSSPTDQSHNDIELHIYATKTFLTTLTYTNNVNDFQTRTHTSPDSDSIASNQIVDPNDIDNQSPIFHTRVIENIVTDTVDNSLLRPELISKFRTELLQKKGKTHPNVIVTMATLLGGQTLQITAVNTAEIPPRKVASTTKTRKPTSALMDIKTKLTTRSSKRNSTGTHYINNLKSHVRTSTSSIRRTQVQNTLVQTQLQSQLPISIDDDQSPSESEDKNVYIKPISELHPSTESVSIPVQQFLGSFDLKRLRPMLNVMADLLQKNIVNIHRTNSLGQADPTPAKDSNVEAKNPSITSNFEGPVPLYIPLQLSGNDKENYNNYTPPTPLSNSDSNQHALEFADKGRVPGNNDIGTVNKLTVHSLHIQPPDLEFSHISGDDNMHLQQLKNVSYYRFPFTTTTDPYHTSLLSKGIPIRPGELITANADVIIGRPGGISLEPPKNGPYTHIPLLPPPPPENTKVIVPVSGTGSTFTNNRLNNEIINLNKGKGSDYGNILRPPPPVSIYNSVKSDSLKYQKVIRYPANVPLSTPAVPLTQNFRFQSPPPINQKPIVFNHADHIFGSPQIANINSELNNNEILEIRPIPEIFSTKLPAITSYTTYRSSYYDPPLPHTLIHQMKPTSTYKLHPSASTFSTLLKKDVLSHTVNMHAPPITFKKESENFPYSTAIRGRVAHIPMPLVKIPLHEVNVDVRLTPENNRLIFVPDPGVDSNSQSDVSPSTLKHRNQNYLHEVNKSLKGFVTQPSQYFVENRPDSTDKLPDQMLVVPNKQKIKYNNFQVPNPEMLDAHQTISKVAVVWDNSYNNRRNPMKTEEVFPTHDSDDLLAAQDQKVAYTTISMAISNSTKAKHSKFDMDTSAAKKDSKSWISVINAEDLHQGKPFVPTNQTVSSTITKSGIHKIFVAKGEHFHPRPSQTESLTIFSPGKSKTRLVMPASSSSNALAKSRFDYSHINQLTSTPTAPYASLHSEEHILKYSLHQRTTPADKFLDLQPSPNNKYSVGEMSINTKPFQISMSREQLYVPLTTATIKPSTKSKPISSSISSSTIIYLYSLAPQPPSQRSSNIHHNRSENTILKNASESFKKLEPSEIFDQSPISTSATQTEFITTNFLSVSTLDSKSKQNSYDKPTHSRLLVRTYIKNKPSVPSELSPSYISKNSLKNNPFSLTDVQQNIIKHRSKSDLAHRSTIPLESSEFAISSSITIINTPYTNRSFIYPTTTIIQTISSPLSSHHLNDTNFSRTSSLLNNTVRSKDSKTLRPVMQTVSATAHSKTVIKVGELSFVNQTYLLDLVPSKTMTIATTSLKLNTTGTPQKIVIESIIKATVDLSPISPDNTENKLPLPTSKTSTLKTDMASIAENRARIAGMPQRNDIIDPKEDLDIGNEYAARDEEILPPIDSNSILLGGVLIDSPRKTHLTTAKSPNNMANVNEMSCSPACRSSKNEICIALSTESHCECRPGFARMFPDRPCKPTYTYELHLQTNRVGTYRLIFNDALKGNSSNEYRQLRSIILDAVDRMVMQSDFRDIYHGVQLENIETDNKVNKTVIGNFLLQLSESSDLKRLESVFKKYLRQSNYSIGGTELYTSKEGINSLAITDFDECGHDNFNDCSEHAHCFNLVGSYTCSCSDGFVDTSNNAIYPGRQCSDNIIGCDKCNYNGKCVAMLTGNMDQKENDSATTICQCFPWHAGATCQLNLKILLICLIAIGTFLLVLLLFCILLLYMRRKGRGRLTTSPIFITASTLHPNLLTSGSNKTRPSASLINQTSLDKHAILNDSNSESSHSSISYLHRESVDANLKKHKLTNTSNTHKPRTSPFQTTRSGTGSENSQTNQSKYKSVEMVLDSEQTDRSLTFMIPRAKYYHPFPFRNQSDFSTFTEKSKQLKISPINATGSGPGSKECTTLVSAGFEVSAIVSDQIVGSGAYSGSGPQILNTSGSEARSNGARSFDETTVRAVTKSMLLNFDMQTESVSHTNEEANTMAERDLGSTFLLPHTHLYKPEKMESDISGFDSI